jgi:ADP-L-glycero-D-manno-heptose 6-epimerase
MYVVTGGAGFIGSNIVAMMEERGMGEIVICDRLRDGGKWRNVAKRELADIVHPDALMDFLENHRNKIKAVIHMGAISSTTETDADLIVETNFRLSMALWQWCAHNQTPFIYASSAATYGDGELGFDDDTSLDAMARLRPLNPYGWSKHLFDRRVGRMLEQKEAAPPHWAGVKFFNVYGPNEYHKGSMQSVVSHVFPRAKDGVAARLFKSHHADYSDGGQMRDFIYVKDCVDVVLWLLEQEGVNGLFNCGTGRSRSFADLTAAVFVALGKEPSIEYIETPQEIRDKYQYFTEAMMDRLKEAGYSKKFTTLEDGVKEYVRDFLNTDDPYR